MKIREVVELGVRVAAVCCMVVITLLVAKKELGGASVANAAQAADRRLTAGEWNALWDGPDRIGSSDAAVQVVLFVDYECPATRGFYREAIRPLVEESGEQVAITFRHLPPPQHPLAVELARSAVCARQSDVLADFNDLVFAMPVLRSGLLREVMSEGELTDSLLTSCLNGPLPAGRLQEDERLASQAGIDATPTVIINGLRLGRVPTLGRLRELVSHELNMNREPSATP